MDSLSNNVSNIQHSLQSAKERLSSLDATSKNTVAAEVAAVRSSLHTSLGKAQHAKLQMSSFLLLLENVEDPTTVNMAPQISWLARSLDGVTASITQAEASADSALQSTMDCCYQVMDVGRDVEAQDDLLDECQSQAKELASQAESSLTSSEAILAQTQRDASAKEEEIRIKTRQANEKRTRKTELDREISQKNGQIAETHRRRESKKESAGVGLILTGIGLMAAPFTAGASLGLAAAGAGFAGYKGVRVSDLKDEIVALRSRVSTLNGEISQDQQVISSLETEQRNLQNLVSQYQRDISSRRSTHQLYQKQISEANRVENDITTLKGVAEATISNINDVNSELQDVKECLDECSSLLQAKSVDLSTSATSIDWIIGAVGRCTRKFRAKEFERQITLMQQVAEVLEKIEQEGQLLLSSQNMAFLDAKPWDDVKNPIVEEHETIPELIYIR
ncbi:uncharacterized protein FFB20_11066 [Fusarium fujikuroi]|uniref:Uncharacterized protein n=2 Tax=Fusarium fujikuroi TaxID=5127 RepID=S0E896_GIBF5|nr:uncharacterized protein FFUJ_09108 [Fusarium fujikuroi IMI 58289]KLO99768.1 uncharacterized protein Y057_3626 [Fusarium fujikuroi]KLP17572.1 uncharacterized protein LW94_12998 [Fusarium fujikuroi]QGI66592.1 hypothetical protein CEK27_010563 [Fusarium fujikuroi]QGI83831.1 hypothetical protein CEK25_010560 [Fusarium fujikuroi]QGI97482.1 hypothetical protein CEK26_010551 [Fusarium fujikuroi]